MPVPTPDGVRRLDELAGGAAIVERAAMPGADVLAAAENGDPRIQAIITEAGEALGLGLATLVNVVNPRALNIAGGTLRYPGYLDAALESARRLALPELWRGCTIARVQDERRVVALGALRLAAQRS